MDDFILAKAVALHGLRYTHAEIAQKSGLKKYQVQYALSEVNEDARADGDSQTIMRIMGVGVLPRVADLIGKLKP